MQRPGIGENIAIDMVLLRRLVAAVDRNIPQVCLWVCVLGGGELAHTPRRVIKGAPASQHVRGRLPSLSGPSLRLLGGLCLQPGTPSFMPACLLPPAPALLTAQPRPAPTPTPLACRRCPSRWCRWWMSLLPACLGSWTTCRRARMRKSLLSSTGERGKGGVSGMASWCFWGVGWAGEARTRTCCASTARLIAGDATRYLIG